MDAGVINDLTRLYNTTKLDKTSIVNNHLTSEEGYALDARQANPNVEGSLGAKIKAVNETVNTLKKYVSDGKTTTNIKEA